ncbi:hypothetical protein [Clostridium sp. ZBS18]|uniref:hypothetical protein n=1 Tax=Clostridium sp. ZBS18 TaxID=2949967 RepID=UPI0020799D97|nr:hypothetical protein [Clostridium sp. ZBS18]
MFQRKSIYVKKQLSSSERWHKSLWNYDNPDWISNCTTYCVNGVWYIRDKNQNNKVIKIFKNDDDYYKWYYHILYND